MFKNWQVHAYFFLTNKRVEVGRKKKRLFPVNVDKQITVYVCWNNLNVNSDTYCR